MQIQSVRQGSAAVSRTAQKSPMELLVNLIDDDPTADNDRLFKAWLKVVRDDEDYLIPALRHTFTNMVSCLDRDRRSAKPRRLTPQQRAAQAKAETAVVEAVKQKILCISLDFVMPSGKALRYCTGKECAQAGGWLAKIAKRVKPNEMVGSVLNESQLRKLIG